MDILAVCSLFLSASTDSLAKNILVCALLVRCGGVLPRAHREDLTSWFIGNAHLPFPSCYHIAMQKDDSNVHAPEAELPGSRWSIIKLRPLPRPCLTSYSLIKKVPKLYTFQAKPGPGQLPPAVCESPHCSASLPHGVASEFAIFC